MYNKDVSETISEIMQKVYPMLSCHENIFIPTIVYNLCLVDKISSWLDNQINDKQN